MATDLDAVQFDARAVKRLLQNSTELRRHMSAIGASAVAHAQAESPVESGDYRGAWFFEYVANGPGGMPLLTVENSDWKFWILEKHGTGSGTGGGLHIAARTLTWLEGSTP